MGWDALATINDKALPTTNRGNLKDLKLRRAFVKAANTVREMAGSVDGYLHTGGLDCSACAEIFRKVGINPFSYDRSLTPAEVKKANETANWNFKFTKKEAFAYFSTFEFMKVCEKHNLGIRFY